MHRPFRIDPIIPAKTKIKMSSLKMWVSLFDIIFTPRIQLTVLIIGCARFSGMFAPYTDITHIKYDAGINRKNDFHP